MLRFCAEGQGGSYVASGATTLGEDRPVNLSGGLVSKGHPIGATGLSMIHELVCQSAPKIGSDSLLMKLSAGSRWFHKGINVMQQALRLSALVPPGFDVDERRL